MENNYDELLDKYDKEEKRFKDRFNSFIVKSGKIKKVKKINVSVEMYNLIDSIYDIVDCGGCMYSDDYSYNEISGKDFSDVYKALSSIAGEKLQLKPRTEFTQDQFAVKYNKRYIVFETMAGQGTHHMAYFAESNPNKYIKIDCRIINQAESETLK